MNITGVTQTAPILPQEQIAPQPPAPEQGRVQAQGIEQATSPAAADAMNISLAASVQVMDMAQSSFEDAANQLIASMAATTGVGQNIDYSV